MEGSHMAYAEAVERRIKKIVSRWKKTEDKKMFGGVCFLLNGNMFGGVHKDFLILRLGEEASKSALQLPFVRPFDITGRPMKGWVMVESDGFASEAALEEWLNQAKRFVQTLPAK
jgi:TfoX/Sxy family transcriptional regulator of competence genes